MSEAEVSVALAFSLWLVDHCFLPVPLPHLPSVKCACSTLLFLGGHKSYQTEVHSNGLILI